ncbi:hypothetical protein ACFYXS_02795 [Streptomyces sp. NPDC002574]|uniref:hypothetical protein n=1 Tax=Streptomyces sp. NPDC002574 TaxID=3364652 RepID=UPI0036B759F1
MAIADVNLLALWADLATMTDPRESDPSEAPMRITVGELCDFADAVRLYERTLNEGGDEEEAIDTAQKSFNDARR